MWRKDNVRKEIIDKFMSKIRFKILDSNYYLANQI